MNVQVISCTSIRPGVKPTVTFAFYLHLCVALGLPDRSRSVEDQLNQATQASPSAPPASLTALNTTGEPSSLTTISNNNPSGFQIATSSSSGPSLAPATSTPLLPSPSSAFTSTATAEEEGVQRDPRST